MRGVARVQLFWFPFPVTPAAAAWKRLRVPQLGENQRARLFVWPCCHTSRRQEWIDSHLFDLPSSSWRDPQLPSGPPRRRKPPPSLLTAGGGGERRGAGNGDYVGSHYPYSRSHTHTHTSHDAPHRGQLHGGDGALRGRRRSAKRTALGFRCFAELCMKQRARNTKHYIYEPFLSVSTQVTCVHFRPL